MWTKAANRRDLIDIIQAERSTDAPDTLFSRYDFRATSSLEKLDDNGELLLVWQDDPREALTLPNLIVMGAISQRDFFAWASTYLQTLRPLTAYVRVSNYAVAQKALRVQPVPTLRRLENACIGLILGETATYLDGQHDLRHLPAVACASTCSFVMARALALSFLSSTEDSIPNDWFEARQLTRQSPLSLDLKHLRVPWYVLLGLESGTWKPSSVQSELPRGVFDAVLDLHVKGDIDSRLWHTLISEISGVEELGDMMRGPREDRVSALEEAAVNLRSRKFGEPTLPAFILGYLASQIAPGTMDHLRLLSSYIHSFPGVLMWFGLCAGLHRRSAVASYAGGLGRRVIREVLRGESLLDRPNCDVSLSELRVINSKEKGGFDFDFRTASNSQISVEIAPCVTATFRWPTRSGVSERLFPASTRTGESESITPEIENVASDLHDIAERLTKIAAGRAVPRGKADRKARPR